MVYVNKLWFTKNGVEGSKIWPKNLHNPTRVANYQLGERDYPLEALAKLSSLLLDKR